MNPIQTYHGQCHCGRVQFSLQSPVIDTAVKCNCSICRRKGATMSESYFSPKDFVLLKGNAALQIYQFGDHSVNHYFCRYCGVSPFHEATKKPGYFRVNLNCIDEILLETLTVRIIDGASF